MGLPDRDEATDDYLQTLRSPARRRSDRFQLIIDARAHSVGASSADCIYMQVTALAAFWFQVTASILTSHHPYHTLVSRKSSHLQPYPLQGQESGRVCLRVVALWKLEFPDGLPIHLPISDDR